MYTAPDGTLHREVAAAMPEISEDRLHYSFDLRDDVIFADGKKLDAEDGVYPLEFETAEDVAVSNSRHSSRSTTPGAFIHRLAISIPTSTKRSTPGRRSKTLPDRARPKGPTPAAGVKVGHFCPFWRQGGWTTCSCLLRPSTEL